MPGIAWVVVAGCVIDAAADPRLPGGRRLPSGLGRKRARTMGDVAPRAELRGTPQEHVDRAVARLDGTKIMAACCSDIQVPAVRLTGAERPIICLQNAFSVIAVRETKQPPFARVRGAPNLTSQRGVQHVDGQLTPTVDLKHAASADDYDAASVATSPTDANVILVATSSGLGLFRTDDGGRNWTAAAVPGAPVFYNNSRMAFPTSTRVYLASPGFPPGLESRC